MKKGIALTTLIIIAVALAIFTGIIVYYKTSGNGKITRTKSASEESKKNAAKEKIELVIDAISDNLQDGNINTLEYFENEENEKEIEEILDKNISYVINREKIYFEYGKYVVEVDKNGKIQNISKGKPLGMLITNDDLGKKISYEVKNITDWEIAYVDDESVYIVTKDVLNEKVLASIIWPSNMAYNGKYVYWKNISKKEGLIEQICNEDIWTNIFTNTKYTGYIQGAKIAMNKEEFENWTFTKEIEDPYWIATLASEDMLYVFGNGKLKEEKITEERVGIRIVIRIDSRSIAKVGKDNEYILVEE